MRNRKYVFKIQILEKLSKAQCENLPVYFPGWLSGFIKGSYSLVFNYKLRKSAFTIGKNDE